MAFAPASRWAIMSFRIASDCSSCSSVSSLSGLRCSTLCSRGTSRVRHRKYTPGCSRRTFAMAFCPCSRKSRRSAQMTSSLSLLREPRSRPARLPAIYLRVSTQDQTTANQEHELRQAAERAGWQVVRVYKDHGISGAKGRNGRPAFDTLCRDATKRQFDVVMAWNVDRLGRSLKDLVAFLSELHALGI